MGPCEGSDSRGGIWNYLGVPKAVVGIAIAALVLLPEGLAAARAAFGNRLQTSLKLALGSALATIGLTIPAVALVSIVLQQRLVLGLDPQGQVLLALTLVLSLITLGTGRTTVLQGIVHLVFFAVYFSLRWCREAEGSFYASQPTPEGKSPPGPTWKSGDVRFCAAIGAIADINCVLFKPKFNEYTRPRAGSAQARS